MFFTDRCQVYKTRVSEFADSKASLLGDYLPGKLGMDDGESVIYLLLPGDYSGQLLFFFENGKAARVELKAYATVSNRRRLTGAYSDKSPLVTILPLREDQGWRFFRASRARSSSTRPSSRPRPPARRRASPS